MGQHSQAVKAGVRWLASQFQDWQLVAAMAIAQLLSFLLCVMGSTSGVLAGKGINAPATQSLVNYLLLASTCGAAHVLRWHSRRKEASTPMPLLSNPWYVYLLLAFLDVQGNFLVTKAYQFTSITSVTLLDCFTIPAVMVLSYFVFRARYQRGHVVGSVLCVLGLALLVLTDRASETGGPNPLLGDVLVIMGAAVYAVCNVTQERLLCSTSQWELLAMQGGFGSVLAGTQALILERHAWFSAVWDGKAVAALLGFALALYSFYLLVPLVLVWGGSTVLNLSLLTSDLWAAGARALLFGGFGGTGYYFAGALVVEAAGICVYTAAGATHGREDVAGTQGTAGHVPLPTDEPSGEDTAGEQACLLQHQGSQSPSTFDGVSHGGSGVVDEEHGAAPHHQSHTHNSHGYQPTQKG